MRDFLAVDDRMSRPFTDGLGRDFAAREGFVQVTQELVVLAADGGIGGLLSGISPDWNVFGAVGTKARIIVGVVMAGAILFLLGSAVVGAVHIRVGNQQHNTMETKKGQTMVASSLLGLFAVASMATLFTIVYGFGI
ncbi:hypothetical protein AB0B04_19455 [Streptomyces xinghaiensis]|uniref:hypothetical protein n=1 Tax=Streptomyces TaxID=1883 RepID=UPI001F51DEF6|nr:MULTISPECIES: hypothetical protein [Streptomyces]